MIFQDLTPHLIRIDYCLKSVRTLRKLRSENLIGGLQSSFQSSSIYLKQAREVTASTGYINFFYSPNQSPLPPFHLPSRFPIISWPLSGLFSRTTCSFRRVGALLEDHLGVNSSFDAKRLGRTCFQMKICHVIPGVGNRWRARFTRSLPSKFG